MFAPHSLPRVAALAGLLVAGVAGTAAADVTIEEKSTIDASIFKAHGSSTENISGEKKRHDSELHCEGFMKLLCGNAGSGEIVRLDKNMTYDLQPSKKRYRETPLPTEAERKEMQKRINEAMEKMKQCAAQQPQKPAVDTSKCEMSPAKVEVKNLGADGQILGHDVHHTAITMTSSCTNKETQEVCDMQFGFDTWLTSDKIEGFAERDAFNKAYLQKMGITGEVGVAMAQQVQQMLAPYAEQMKELKAKSADLKGQSLRSSFHVSYGGAKCATAKSAGAGGTGGAMGADVDVAGQAKGAAAQGAADVAAAKVADGSLGGTVASRTLSSVGGKLLGGLFSKKKKPDSEEASGGQAGEKAAEPAAPGMVTMVKFGMETTAVTPGPVPAERFEIPAGWKRIEPKAAGKEEPFTCPKSGKDE